MRILRIRPRSLVAATAAALTLAVTPLASASPANTTPGRDQGRYQERYRGHDRFDDHDRRIVQSWYHGHRHAPPPGLRDRDRRSGFHLGIGVYLDRDTRRYAYGVPIDLRRSLPPAPYGYRYMLINGHLCLVDTDYRVRDMISIRWGF